MAEHQHIIALIEEVQDILNEAPRMRAKKKAKKKKAPASKSSDASHNPFKNKNPIGKGPRGRVMSKKDYWSCSCNDYSCDCTGKEGEKKKVVIKRDYKQDYNADYKAWRKQTTKAKKSQK